jgi:ABC-2 type transport system permease protein
MGGDPPGGDLTEHFLGVIVMIWPPSPRSTCSWPCRSRAATGRAEPVLATALSRTRWIACHLAVVLAGSARVLLTGLAADSSPPSPSTMRA